jgi:hypothetical protein
MVLKFFLSHRSGCGFVQTSFLCGRLTPAIRATLYHATSQNPLEFRFIRLVRHDRSRSIQNKVLISISESVCVLRNSVRHPGNAGSEMPLICEVFRTVQVAATPRRFSKVFIGHLPIDLCGGAGRILACWWPRNRRVTAVSHKTIWQQLKTLSDQNGGYDVL